MSETPDYVYDPADWEVTYDWPNRDELTDPMPGEFWEPKEFYTLNKGPSWWAVEVILTTDEDGDPDEMEIQWFDNLDDAKAAAKAGTG